jgi:hypothetical protein
MGLKTNNMHINQSLDQWKHDVVTSQAFHDGCSMATDMWLDMHTPVIVKIAQKVNE